MYKRCVIRYCESVYLVGRILRETNKNSSLLCIGGDCNFVIFVGQDMLNLLMQLVYFWFFPEIHIVSEFDLIYIDNVF